MAQKQLHCLHCSSSFKFMSAHAGFGDEIYFYCDQCGTVSTVDVYHIKSRPFYRRYITARSYNAQKKEDLDAFKVNFKKMKIEISRSLTSCPCGGTFTVDAVPRCPVCKQELDWKKMVIQLDKNSDSQTPHYFSRFVKKGWRDIYYYIFNDRMIRNNWK